MGGSFFVTSTSSQMLPGIRITLQLLRGTMEALNSRPKSLESFSPAHASTHEASIIGADDASRQLS